MNTTTDKGDRCSWLYEPEHLAEEFREFREIIRKLHIKLADALDDLYEVSGLLEDHLTSGDDDEDEDGGECLFPEPLYDGPPPPKYELSTNGLWAKRTKD